MVFLYSGFPEAPVMSCLTILDNAYFTCLANLWQKQTRLVFPPFIPNDYFFDKYKGISEEKSHIYAWAIREIMSKYSGLPKDDTINLDKKTEYQIKVGLIGRPKQGN
jgi:hypothetical protein